MPHSQAVCETAQVQRTYFWRRSRPLADDSYIGTFQLRRGSNNASLTSLFMTVKDVYNAPTSSRFYERIG